jgi:hypothetical protein
VESTPAPQVSTSKPEVSTLKPIVSTPKPPVSSTTTAPSYCEDKKVPVDLESSNLKPSSNPEKIDNLVYGVGSPRNTWSPLPGDSVKTVEITLPDVNGVPAGDYPIMEVEVKPTGELGLVTVQIFDKNGNKVFEDEYNSTPMQIPPNVPGTLIILIFSDSLTGIYDLQVFACVPLGTTEIETSAKPGISTPVIGTSPVPPTGSTPPPASTKSTPLIPVITNSEGVIPITYATTPAGCTETEIMSIFDMAYNLVASSNYDEVLNILPGYGSDTDYWIPANDDTSKSLTISMPYLKAYGRLVPPEEYLTAEIRINSNGRIGVTVVKVYDIDDSKIYEATFTRAPFILSDLLPGARKIVIEFKEPKEIYEVNVIICMPPPLPVETSTAVTLPKTIATGPSTIFVFESTTPIITLPPTTPEQVCRITDAVLENIRNSLPAEALPVPPVVGWIEKDGNKGPTSDEEDVFKGEKVEAGIIININPCYSCSCGQDLSFNCTSHSDSWQEPSDSCLTYYCENGVTKTIDNRQSCVCAEDEEVVVDNSLSSSCCYCRKNVTGAPLVSPTTPEGYTTPAPPTPCQLKTESHRLSFNTSDGDFCQSPDELLLTECEGACNGFDGLRVKTVWGSVEPESECKCCTGIGRYEPRTVQCANHGRTTVDVMIYEQCICSACAGSDNPV